jgi:outer membrane protein assembly factor BamB
MIRTTNCGGRATIVVGIAFCSAIVMSSCDVAYATEPPILSPHYIVTAADGAAHDRFGTSLAAHGDRFLVGAPGSSLGDGTITSPGAAYLFDAASGTQLRKFMAPNARRGDYFGRSVALTDRHAVISAHGRNNFEGAAFVYDIESGDLLFELDQEFPSRDFSLSVAATDNVGIVAARSENVNGFTEHPVYVFDLDTGEQLRRIPVDVMGIGNNFALDMDLHENTLVIGSVSTMAAAYVVDIETGEQITLLPEDALPSSAFGLAVSVFDGIVAVGEISADPITGPPGVVHLFDANTGQQLRTLVPTGSSPLDSFGDALDMLGNRLLVGENGNFLAPLDGVKNTAYLFDVASGEHIASLPRYAAGQPPDVPIGFGSAVALTSQHALIGVWPTNRQGTSPGAVFAFPIPEPSTIILMLLATLGTPFVFFAGRLSPVIKQVRG